MIDPSTGVRLELQTWWYLEFGWLSRGSMHAYIHDGDQSEFFGGVMVAVDSIAGSWEAYDPLDPPRVQGRIETMEGAQFRVRGTFDAALCDAWIRGLCPD